MKRQLSTPTRRTVSVPKTTAGLRTRPPGVTLSGGARATDRTNPEPLAPVAIARYSPPPGYAMLPNRRLPDVGQGTRTARPKTATGRARGDARSDAINARGTGSPQPKYLAHCRHVPLLFAVFPCNPTRNLTTP